MPTRRTFELVVITVVLMAPALAMVQLWLKKHIVVTGTGVTAEAAAVGLNIL
jgi:hypothetical protein